MTTALSSPIRIHAAQTLLIRIHAATLADVTDENGRPPGPDEVPGVHKTVNQIVAWNIASYRKAAGLTQEELGDLIGGRSKRNVSADERSWDGGHTREFNAHEIVAYAVALDIPIGAFFLPPAGDGIIARFLIRLHDRADCLDMAGLMRLVMPDTDNGGRAMNTYRRRIIAAVRRYLDPSWSDDLKLWMKQMTGPEIRAARPERWRAHRLALDLMATDTDEIIGVFEEAGDAG